MSSRDRRSHSQRSQRDPRGSYRDDFAVSADDTFEDDVEFEPADERSAGRDTDDVRRSRFPSGGSSAREGTAEQISRLRQSVSRGVSRPSPSRSRPSIGRNYFARPQRTSDDDPYLDEDDELEDVTAQPTERRVYRPASRRRDDAGAVHPQATQRDDRFDASDDDDDEDSYYEDDDDFTEYDAPRGSTWNRASPRTSGAQPISRPTLPPAITQADVVNDAAALTIIGIGVLSLAAMAITVANQSDSLAPSFPTHVSASGVLEDFRGPSGLWRLPLLSAMLTLMNIVAAWFISPLDRFASRFLLAAAVVVQLVAWVAIIRIL